MWWALEFMDLQGEPQSALQMDRLAAWLSRHPGCDWHAAVSPHAPYSASSKLYRECARLSGQFHIPFTTHWGESIEEEELFRTGKGPLRSLLPGTWTPGKLSDRAESLPGNSLIAHGNRISGGDMEILARGAVYVVHCPTSHAWFGREPFPLERFQQNKIPVVIGTDSPASSENHTLDLRMEARAFRQVHPSLSPAEIWSMLTELPARALGQEGRLGRLGAGAEADWVGWRLSPSADPVSAILASTGPAEILSVAGRLHRPEGI